MVVIEIWFNFVLCLNVEFFFVCVGIIIMWDKYSVVFSNIFKYFCDVFFIGDFSWIIFWVNYYKVVVY